MYVISLPFDILSRSVLHTHRHTLTHFFPNIFVRHLKSVICTHTTVLFGTRQIISRTLLYVTTTINIPIN